MGGGRFRVRADADMICLESVAESLVNVCMGVIPLKLLTVKLICGIIPKS